MSSSKANRSQMLSLSTSMEQRASSTANCDRLSIKLFSPEQMDSLKLTDLRQKRRQLQQKLKNVSNRLNFRKKKEEDQLRKFIKSQQKSISMMETIQYKKFNEMLKEELGQKKEFEMKKKAKEIEDLRMNKQKRLSLIHQAVKDRKISQSQKVRVIKKVDQDNLKFSREISFSLKRQQCQAINKLKERQNTKKRCYWYEKRMTFQHKMMEEAQIYEKQIDDYYRKIEMLRTNEQKLQKQKNEAEQILRCTEQNFHLLKQS